MPYFYALQYWAASCHGLFHSKRSSPSYKVKSFPSRWQKSGVTGRGGTRFSGSYRNAEQGSCQRDHALFLAEDGIRCNGFSPLAVGTTGLDFFYKQHRGFPSLFFTVCVYYSGCFLTFPLFSGRRRKNRYQPFPKGPELPVQAGWGPPKA